ncbi:Os07g0206300 [Oryza sativa Japonica Group]|uniref:Os07g0206300 protein n=2 Tax=Oryza sativa subsp. japonica TaxID=39947 RepID=C7J4G1_ORYSJ|nr:hypothetical protein EE612_037769 [Oryza sativa]BAH93828.1 Os07g0206450 [Oryza sativa Japonica Group]BAT00547.1 Os07g0206300 [Oryza sativa Japonica Group]|eukprot:NP_001175100.1 Os07g0206450 [Oryza sativa Japonica Group]
MPLAAVSSAPPHPMAPSPSPSLAPPLLPPRRQIRPPPWSRAPDADELRREDRGEGKGLCWPRFGDAAPHQPYPQRYRDCAIRLSAPSPS